MCASNGVENKVKNGNMKGAFLWQKWSITDNPDLLNYVQLYMFLLKHWTASGHLQMSVLNGCLQYW